jgi:glycerol-3-phosphate acyltransferase PlsY
MIAVLPPDFVVVMVLLGYLLGSIPTGVLFARAKGIDLTQTGSGNIGATNAARALGKKIGALVLLGDALKGLLPVLLARHLFGGHHWGHWIAAATALAAFLGHLFPIWLGFRGGKGVATGLGVFLALAPIPTLICGGVFIAVYAAFRIASLGSLLATTAFVPVALLFHAPRATVTLGVLLWALIVYKHRGNISRLLKRAEAKV